MKLDGTELFLSASDLANHFACRHLTALDRRVAEGSLARPDHHDPALEVLLQRGLEHEKAYVEHLRGLGLKVVELRDVEAASALERTRQAARDGADVIVQAALSDGRVGGRADVLRREAGEWIVEDTKLAQETRGGTVLQLCLYADLVTTLQGTPARLLRVVKPGFEVEEYAFRDFAAYYRLVRARLERFVDAKEEPPYPEPVPHCDVCRWWKHCDKRRHDDDHLSLVAGLQRLHTAELEGQGTRTLEAFATGPLSERPRRGSRATFASLQEQARVQLEGRRRAKPHTVLLPYIRGEDHGLARLPEPTPGDVFLDFEGDPFVGEAGLEYLLGYVHAGEYAAHWGLAPADERRAFETFVDLVTERLRANPGLHVYHYATYEPAALRRLAMRHATREAELDRLLRGKRFVDLHAVTRHGLRASVESYSLKELERFFGYERKVDLRAELGPAKRRLEKALELGDAGAIAGEDRAKVEGYNEDDCRSLVKLRAWLEEKRAELGVTERPELKSGDVEAVAEEKKAEVRAVVEALAAGGESDAARWLLAHLVEYFHREDKVAWWEYFAQKEADLETLLDDRHALVGLERITELTRVRGTPVQRYRFPPQETSFEPGDEVRDLHRIDKDDELEDVGTIVAIDVVAGTVDIKKRRKTADVGTDAIHLFGRVPPQPLDGSVLDLANWVLEHSVDSGDREHRAARDLLLRRPPRTRSERLQRSGEESLAAALRVARDLDGGVLAIQGPPGAGKTYIGARMIAGLVEGGARVGISATSHKVVRNLVDEVLKVGEIRVTHKISDRRPPTHEVLPAGLTETTKNGEALAALDAGHVVGGVAWLWAAQDAEATLDYLFLDEAGQMSLAHVLAASRAARNLVLLGDPQQLQQPQRGAHPEGAEVSALKHLLGEHDTMPEDQGLFLSETHRLHPSICAFTSECYYDGKLRSRAGCERQALVGSEAFAQSGLFYVPVEHEHAQSRSLEEVDAVEKIARDLLRGKWVNAKGEVAALRPEDVLVIAPYNAQVAALKERLPDLRIGTVDKFQGQEAPVVVYSLTSSSVEDAPRGLSFLFDPHRLNVATSRARCAVVLVGSTRLFEPECRTPQHMKWANGMCRYREMASERKLP